MKNLILCLFALFVTACATTSEMDSEMDVEPGEQTAESVPQPDPSTPIIIKPVPNTPPSAQKPMQAKPEPSRQSTIIIKPKTQAPPKSQASVDVIKPQVKPGPAPVPAPVPSPAPKPRPTYHADVDVEKFLNSFGSSEEKKALDRLNDNDITPSQIKSILKRLPNKNMGPKGLRRTEQITSKGKSYSYALYVPKSARANDSYPLLIMLHGAGSSGTTAIDRWVERMGDDFIIACPTYLAGAWWTRNAELLVLNLIKKLKSQYPVDPNRVILSGVSNGAVGAYMIGTFNPDIFAGLAPIAGTITERYMNFLVNLNNTPIYIIHGKYDPIFPIKFSQRIHRILSDMRYPVVFREHQEKGKAHGGHFLPQSEVSGLVRWMKSQKRPGNSKVVRMTREANHLNRVQWVQVTKGKQLAALQVPGPEGEPLLVRDGKIATLFAINRKNNTIEVMGENVLEYDIYLNSDMVDFDKPVSISHQKIVREKNQLIPGEKKLVFKSIVPRDIGFLLRDYKNYRDLSRLFEARITISLVKDVNLASLHGLNPR